MLTLALIGLLGGLITGVSPCVLPMLPIIFFAGGEQKSGPAAGAGTTRAARSTGRSTGSSAAVGTSASMAGAAGAGGSTLLDVQPDTDPSTPPRKRRSFRPLAIIAGIVVSFSVFTLVGSTLLSLLHLPQDFLRWSGLIVLTAVGVGLIFPAVGHLIEKPFYRLPKVNNKQSGAFVLGLGLGTLYVPCAGPVLAAITVAGATGQIGWSTVVLTIAFAIGAALPLLAFATAGQNISQRINAYRSRARTFRIVGGLVMIALAAALALNVSDAIQRLVPAYTGGIEKTIAESKTVQGALSPFPNAENRLLSNCTPGAGELASCGEAPALRGTQQWFNTADDQPVTLASLKGKVVLLDFFAYSCINCQRDAPYIKQWYAAYQKAGFEVIGIHSPEFAFEKSASNLESALKHEGLTYPVVQDNDLKTWTAYRNAYWPAKYLIDTTGTVRAIKFGEGDYAQTEGLIRQLLQQANPSVDLPGAVTAGAATAGTPAAQRTPELYLSAFKNAGYLGSPQIGKTITQYRLNANQPVNTYSLGGTWDPEGEYLGSTGASQLRLHYRATNVFHVLAGTGTVTVSQEGQPDRVIQVSGTPNLYPIVEGKVTTEGTLTFTYSKGVQAYTFTFG